MLPPRLKHIKERIDAKSSSSSSEGERQLLRELNDLDGFLDTSEGRMFRESARKYTQITSGPGGSCECCGR